ncbi:uncharacterized protein RSE6_05227 [Rhynchosporium secalis]|uniref:Ubiquitin 3 binding protein But2 C-terminal domain-containing protein n=1 Tax=Rhynchosporium secalis TaxID=38038 RepID=A0A1E1M8F8_RHYSE|nr:uncharacterized protein RSE6_05227 [Rhynchosporium secalis]
MKSNMIIMLVAVLLGLCLGEIAKKLPGLPTNSLLTLHSSPVTNAALPTVYTTHTSTFRYTTTVSSVATPHSQLHAVISTSGSSDLGEYYYDFDVKCELCEDKTKMELRGLNGALSDGSDCPSDISGDYQFPHLIVPTSVGMPDASIGNQYMVYISPAATTLFNFDIPATYTGTCALLFLFPYISELDPSAGKYRYSGMEQVEYQNGGLNFALLSGVADNSTTFNTTPPVAVDYGKTKIFPGHNYTVATFPCLAGENITIQASSANKTELDYFQNTASMPIGLFLVKCD